MIEWERSLSLPDPRTASTPSIQQRQAAVRAKWGARGSLTKAYFIMLAANLGFSITFTEFRAFEVDMPVDEPLLDSGWAFIWQVDVPRGRTITLRPGRTTAEERPPLSG